MQQPMNQQEPIGGQHQQAMSQQMVLCPVRFVYETQVLVQPGDQIQPNQTFFINPQNPPPWMQNRAPAPNPVVYVQQVPNNMVSSVQQHMDQNQLYLQQNFANFQLQQHMLAQNHQEMRPTMQLANIVPNMVQNVQQNINERNINQNSNTGQMQANAQNMIQNQMNVANARQVPNQVNQTVEVQRQVFMNVRPQMNQQVNLSRPVMSVNQFQNMALANMQNVQLHQANVGQNFVQNIGQRALTQNVNAVRPQATNNTMNVQPVAKVREGTPSEANKSNTAVGTGVPNVKNFAQNYNCRPIQPRRRYVQNNNVTPKAQTQQFPAQTAQHAAAQTAQHNPAQNVQHTPTQNVQHIPIQNVQQIPVQSVQHNPVQHVQHIPVQSAPTQYNNEKSNSHQIVTNIAANTTYLNNPNINRKRKSESPDEIQNKMAMHSNAKPNYNSNLQQGIIVTKLCNEIGTNTSPVHKPNINTKNASFQMNPNTQMITIENVHQTNENLIKNMTEPKNITITPLPSEKDKLIRNTVYTQARGRLLQDKISDNLLPQVTENIAPENIQNTTRNTDNTPVPMEVQNEKTHILTEMQTSQHRIVIEVQAETAESKKIEASEIKNIKAPKIKNIEAPEIKNIDAPEIKKIEAPKVIKIETPEIIKIETTEIKKIKAPENKPEITDKTEIEAHVDTEVKGEHQSEENEQTTEGNDVKLEAILKSDSKQDILTHVVDGYVIQESNFAFPIRKPLKEKTLFTNSKTEESEATDALKECMKEEMKNTGVDIPLLPFHYLLLNCDKKEEEETKIDENESGEPNPFAELQHTAVKSWTVEDLSSHLLKFNWNDTVSVFQDHEIDGESLFLVSKPQLMTIGVTEEHADAICEFVRS